MTQKQRRRKQSALRIRERNVTEWKAKPGDHAAKIALAEKECAILRSRLGF